MSKWSLDYCLNRMNSILTEGAWLYEFMMVFVNYFPTYRQMQDYVSNKKPSIKKNCVTNLSSIYYTAIEMKNSLIPNL